MGVREGEGQGSREGSRATKSDGKSSLNFCRAMVNPGVGRGTMVAGGGGGGGGAVVQHRELGDSTPSLHPLRSAGLRVKCCSNSLCSRNREEEETTRIG